MANSTAKTRKHNKDLSRRFLEELWNQKNVAIIDELLAATYVDHTPPLDPSDKEPQGPEDLKQLFETISQQFIDIRVSIEDQIAEEDRVMSRVTWQCTLKGNDSAVTVMGVGIDRIHRGKIVENWNTLDVLYRLLNLVEKPDDTSAVPAGPVPLPPLPAGVSPLAGLSRPCNPPCSRGFACRRGRCQRL